MKITSSRRVIAGDWHGRGDRITIGQFSFTLVSAVTALPVCGTSRGADFPWEGFCHLLHPSPRKGLQLNGYIPFGSVIFTKEQIGRWLSCVRRSQA